MDLSLLPSSCSKLNKIDKTAIENDRKEFWDLFYKKVKLVVLLFLCMVLVNKCLV